MPGVASFGEVIFVLGDLIVAPYDVDNDAYGAPFSLVHGQQLMVEPESDTDDLRSYGVIGDMLAIPVAANITLGQGAMDRDGFRIVAGSNDYTSGTTPNRVVTVDFKAGLDGDLPYFGAIGVGRTTGGGYAVVGLQKCKLGNQPNFSLDGNQNQFMVQEIEGRAIPVVRNNIQMNIRLKIYETDTDWTAPTTGSAFKAFFTSPVVA